LWRVWKIPDRGVTSARGFEYDYAVSCRRMIQYRHFVSQIDVADIGCINLSARESCYFIMPTYFWHY
jgi:hypothetical protein